MKNENLETTNGQTNMENAEETVNNTENIATDVQSAPAVEVKIMDEGKTETFTENDFAEKPKKSKKGLIIALVIVGIIIILIGGFFAYVKMNYSADKFIDKNVNAANKWINEIFKGSSNETIDLSTTDATFDGTLKLSTNSTELSSLNDLSISYNGQASLKNEYGSLALDLKQNNTSALKGTFYLNKKDIYIDSSDIYTVPLKYTMDENIFNSVEESLNVSKIMSADAIKQFLQNTIDNLGEALKESDMSTTSKGLKVEYTYEITTENQKQISDKFSTLMEQEQLYKEFDKYLTEIDSESSLSTDLNIEPMTLTVTVNILTGKVEEFKIIVDNEEYIGTKIEDNKFKIEQDKDNYFTILNEDKIIEIALYEKGNEVDKLSLENTNDKIKLTIKVEDVNADITLNSKKADTTLDLNLTANGIKINGTITDNYDNKQKEEKTTLDLKATYEGQEYGINMSINAKYGDDLVTVKNFSNAKEINSLTEEEQSNLMVNLMTKLGSISIVNDFMIMGGATDDMYDSTDNYDI